MTDTTVPAIRPPAREIRVVEHAIPLLDTAYFEHLQRIAGAMAQGSLIPETLRGKKEGNTFVPFDQQTVVANVFRVVNQAVRWDMDPFAVIDHASVVHGRLMWEGKLVDAVVEAQTGIRMTCVFGRMVEFEQESGTKVLRFDPSEEGAGVNLAIQVSGVIDGVTETIEGTVEQWKTTGNNSPWGNPANFKRQLRYRGKREWARAHRSGVMLGILTNDEVIENVEVQERVAASRGGRVKADLRSQLAAPAAKAGFDPAHVASETATTADGTEHNAQTGEVIGGKVVDGKQAALDERAAALAKAQEMGERAKAFGAANDTASAAALEKEATTDEERGFIHNGWIQGFKTRTGPSGDKVDAERQEEEGSEGGDTDADGDDDLEDLRQTAFDDGYQGEPVQAILSECDTDEEREIATAAHAAGVAKKIEDLAAEGGAIGTQEPFPGDKKPDEAEFEDVAGPAPKDEKYLLAREEADAKGTVQIYVNGQPFSQVPADKAAGRYKRYDGHPEPADPALKSQGGGKGVAKEPTRALTLGEKLAAKASWHEIKTELSPLYGSDDFKALEPGDQARTRAMIFDAVLAMKERTQDPVDWATDPTAFGLFADHTALGGDKDAADMIEGTFATLQASDGWKRLNEAQQATMTQRIALMVKNLR